jgi:hypothetical protein
MKLKRTALCALLAGLMLVPAVRSQQKPPETFSVSPVLPEGQAGARVKTP